MLNGQILNTNNCICRTTNSITCIEVNFILGRIAVDTVKDHRNAFFYKEDVFCFNAFVVKDTIAVNFNIILTAVCCFSESKESRERIFAVYRKFVERQDTGFIVVGQGSTDMFLITE